MRGRMPGAMRVLVLNSGSSSVKFQLIDSGPQDDRVLARGLVDNIGGLALLKCEVPGGASIRESEEVLEHRVAIQRVLALLQRRDLGVLGSPREIEAVGHRVVHGGERFSASVRFDDDVVRQIEECFDIAPLHNPPNVKGYRAARELLGDEVPQVAVFDTAFHQTMPREAYMYALPQVLYQRHGIRRYGFHGTSHRWVSRRLALALGRDPADPRLRLVTCHLGNGCSMAAIRGSRSVDTTMGFTPLEGLVMGTRSGDLDPAVLLHVMQKEDLGRWELNALLNKHSGLVGLSGLSNDMRTLLEADESGHDGARLAIDVFCLRIRKYVGAYMAELGGLDGLAFAGGIGENAPQVRWRSLRGLDELGIALDERRNAQARGEEAEISRDGSPVRVFVVPTNEELLIARDTAAIVQGRPTE